MANPEEWKTEFHVIDPGGQAQDWLEDEDEAIEMAKALGPGAIVERVISYLDDRTQVWPTDDAGEDA